MTDQRPPEPAHEPSNAPAPSRTRGFGAELHDAITPRSFGLVLGVLLLQLGFILSYVGAFHHPTPHRIPVGIVAPAGASAGTAARAATQLNAIGGAPVRARAVTDEATARSKIKNRDLDGALLLGASKTDRLLVAGAEGGAVSQALESVIASSEQSQQRTLAPVEDIVPSGAGDARGLSSFYVAVGWVVGGYLVASILAISAGALPANARRASIRLGALVLYSTVSGLGGAVIAGPALGALNGHFWAVTGVGTLLVFAVGAFTMAIQALTGIIGIGIAVLLFVVLGNPSAGGAYPTPLLPPFWRAIGAWLPPGAGTSALRGIVYFDGADVGGPMLVSALYAVVGAAVLLLVATGRSRRQVLAST